MFPVLLAAFQNCADFSSGSMARKRFFAKQQVFASSVPSETNPDENLPPQGSTPPGGENPESSPTPEPYATATPRQAPIIPLEFDCSNHMHKVILGGSILDIGDAFALEFTDANKVVQCRIRDRQIFDDIINLKAMRIEDLKEQCPQLKAGRYTLRIPAKKSGTWVYDANRLERTFMDSLLYTQSPDTWEFHNGLPVMVTADGEALHASAVQTGKRAFVLYGDASAKPACDENGNSPLIVRLGTGAGPIDLRAPLDGIWFDILGARSQPRPHAPKRISWLRAGGERNNFFLVLPDSRGRVNGIDEMFGNNTAGPDGKFAANGYEALRKWDKNRDGKIDRNDPVFKWLRLWSDADVDGIAHPSELMTLDQLRVASLDLDYDRGYVEKDQYGNRTTMRSLVRTLNGEMHFMYDLWFRNL